MRILPPDYFGPESSDGPIAFCAYDVEKLLPSLPDGRATIAEISARLPKYSIGLIRKACRFGVMCGRLTVRDRYENRAGRMPREYAARSVAQVGGGLESLAPSLARPEPPVGTHAPSEGFSK